ncbi:hypothetical protein ACFXG4_17955 [Nocardia sp. NPDC059246]|uniref:hypothetical protein n=1 Tax=unclassified Nocardia TaxID=2637762 RepID=UPI00369EE3D9
MRSTQTIRFFGPRAPATVWQAIDKNPFDGIDRYDSLDDLSDTMPPADCERWREHLQASTVFFSWPLDLDLSLLRAYRDHYIRLEGSETGPRETDARAAMLGVAGARSDYWNPVDQNKNDERQDELRWHRYLFKTRSKPSTHLRALATVPAAELAEPPSPLAELITLIAQEIAL